MCTKREVGFAQNTYILDSQMKQRDHHAISTLTSWYLLFSMTVHNAQVLTGKFSAIISQKQQTCKLDFSCWQVRIWESVHFKRPQSGFQ
jgi:hypothetical protein